MVTIPLSPVLMKALMSNHSSGTSESVSVVGVQEASQLNPSTIPPLAVADTFKNDLRLY